MNPEEQARPPGTETAPLFEIESSSEAGTLEWARAFAGNLRAGQSVALSGDLGAGKTVVARGLALGLDFEGEVLSPSYALIHEYKARTLIIHVDLYRLSPGSDWEEIGLEHYLQQKAISIVEWPERLPKDRWDFTYWIRLDYRSDYRRQIRVFGSMAE